MKVMPIPSDWLDYVTRDEMKSNKLGVFAHCFVKDGEQENIKEAYKKIVDIAIEEETCSVLSASKSLVLPNHHLLYEEWLDYDEFFNVQLKRTYRNAFYRWLDPIRNGPVSPEFTRILFSSGAHPIEVAPQNAYSLITSVQIPLCNHEKAHQLLKDHIQEKNKNGKRIFVNAHQSLNEPNHFLIYEIWLDFDELLKSDRQDNQSNSIRNQLGDIAIEKQKGVSVELFQIYYDPKKYNQ